MKNSNSLAFTSKGLGCLAFDIAVAMAFYKYFGLFSTLATDKSFLILLIMVVGLAILNTTIIFSDSIFKGLGLPYSMGIVDLLILYAIMSNAISIFLIDETIVWYIIWQLTLAAVFLGLLSIITCFSKKAEEDRDKVIKEKNDKDQIKFKLIKIEATLEDKKNYCDILPIIYLFNTLKERIQSSTPFGRVSDNCTAIELENKIKNNLASLQQVIDENLTDKNLIELRKLIEETLKLVICREKLIIR